MCKENHKQEHPEYIAQEEMEMDRCQRCGCCDTEWKECSYCGGNGGRGWEDDLQFEDPLWYNEDDFIPCDICEGKGGWVVCAGECDEEGKHNQSK